MKILRYEYEKFIKIWKIRTILKTIPTPEISSPLQDPLCGSQESVENS